MIGKKILHYQILQKLGEGGMGIVYLAEDTRLDRRVAIKFLPRHIAGNSDERKRFEIEAKAAAALNHPNIATIHAIENTADDLFIVMEYIQGQTLHDKITADRVLPPADCIDIAVQIASGLQAAHEKSIIHRDIKSSNIMITEKGQVKIMDFGLAKVRGSAQITKAGTTVGTVAYMSPEQARGEPVDNRSDIWSFGVVLYEMLSGKLPFTGDYEQAVIYAILNETPNLKPERFTDVDKAVLSLLDGLLRKESAERIQNINESLRVLNELKSGSTSKIIVVQAEGGLFRSRIFRALIAIVIIVSGTLGWRYYEHSKKETWARNEILPKIDSLAANLPWTGEGGNSWQAYRYSNQIKDNIPDDPYYKSIQKKFLIRNSFITKPAAVKIYIKAYADTSDDWLFLGESPIDSVFFPTGFSKVKFEKDGFETGYDLVWNAGAVDDTISYTLIPKGLVPEGMVYVSGNASWFNIKAAPAGLHLPGLEQTGFINSGDFYMDRYEVSNKEYKKFVDAGGYQNPDYWKYPFVLNGKQIDREKAMSLFVDKTGQPGPASWEIGDYPPGKGNFPVTGVSWYEAAAYAEFMGKSLPTIFHWDRVAFTWASPNIVPQSNIAGTDLREVNFRPSENRFGVFNLAGNVREWCFNDCRRGRFILGGGWSDPVYSFNDAYAQSPFDRSDINGFRCIKYISQDNIERLKAEIDLPWRDFLKEKPVPDETFNYFLKQYSYDKTALDAEILSTREEDDWIEQIIRINAAYGAEKMNIYLFLPKNIRPPYQTLIFFPGSGAIHTRSSKYIGLGSSRNFIVKSGRALIWPIYKSTYERGDNLLSDTPEPTNSWKDHIIMWTKDFSRTVDYLETRNDIDPDRLIYYGVSWGGAMGGIIPAVEKRLSGCLLLVAGLPFQRTLPEVETINYLPRIKMPVLMLNGRYDFFFPYETAQIPFYKLLGTPEKNKKIFVYEGGHIVPHTELAKETLIWLDTNFGKVQHK
jgi:serine/threonine protein kinase/dienelactone hydrolase